MLAVGLASALGLAALIGDSSGRYGLASTDAAATSGSSLVALRRLTEQQYRNTVADIFGSDIVVAGKFEPERRIGGLLAAGGAELSITAAGFASYTQIAETVADQVIDEKRRAKLVPCTPASATAPDAKCAAAFFSHYGPLLYRRPLTPAQLDSRVQLATKAAAASKDFYAGLWTGLVSLMSSPEFLFRAEMAVQDSQGQSLDGYSRAQRLSFMFWDSSPDAELLRAAASGELATQPGLARQIDRLIASPRFEAGMRAFYEDMLHLDKFGTLSKDAQIFPNFSDRVALSAHEETLRSVIDLTVKQDGDYRDIVTTRKTFVNRTLASIYDVPYSFDAEWTPYEFPESAGRSGILTQATFLSLFAHPGRGSPTLRGIALNEILMCQPTPPPPADVDFSLVNDANPNLKTVRARLEAHATNPACASCHNRSDPIGLALENFDSIGQYRTLDNGEPVDASAKIGQKSFVGAVGLGQVLREEPRLPSCLARSLLAYGAGTRTYDVRPAQVADSLKVFADSGYRVRALIRDLASREAFYRTFGKVRPTAAPAVQQVALTTP